MSSRSRDSLAHHPPIRQFSNILGFKGSKRVKKDFKKVYRSIGKELDEDAQTELEGKLEKLSHGNPARAKQLGTTIPLC